MENKSTKLHFTSHCIIKCIQCGKVNDLFIAQVLEILITKPRQQLQEKPQHSTRPLYNIFSLCVAISEPTTTKF
jgi:hypothetical protein